MTIDNFPAQNPAQAQPGDGQAETPALKFNEARLSDGRIVSVRRGKGRDVRDAARLATSGNEMELGLAMASLAASIDGKPVIYDDFLDWDLEDCYAVANVYQAMKGKGN